MIDGAMRKRDPVGSNDSESAQKGKTTLGGRPERQKKQPPASSATDEYNNANSAFEDEDAPMSVPDLNVSRLAKREEAQAEQEQRPRPVKPRTTTVTTNEGETIAQPTSPPSSPTSSEDWEQVPDDGLIPTTPPFPGTWPAALHDTTAALSSVSTATMSYAGAIASSGLGRASWSVGVAALSSTNKLALSLADWGVKKTALGLIRDELPRPVARWIDGKEEKERRRRLIGERRRRRQNVEHGQTLGRSFRDKEGDFGIVLHDMDSTGEFMGKGPPSRWKAGNSLETKTEDRTKTEMDGWDAQRLGVRQRGDYDKGVKGEEDGDGLVRVFEFDDDDDDL